MIFLVAPWAWPTHSGISSGKRRHLFHLFANAYIGIVYQLSFIGSRYTVQLSQIDCQIKFQKTELSTSGLWVPVRIEPGAVVYLEIGNKSKEWAVAEGGCTERERERLGERDEIV